MQENEEKSVNAPDETAKECACPQEESAQNPALEEEISGADAAQKQKTKKSKRPTADEALKNFDGRTIEPPKKKKYGWIGTLFLLAVIALGIFLMFKIVNDADEEAKSLAEVIAGGSWQFALVTLAVIVVILTCDWFKYAVVMKTTTGKLNLRSSLKVAFLGKFYDNVTPFAAGGQPMQIYYLHKKGFSGGISSAVILIKYFAQMFCWTLASLVLMACNTGVLSKLNDPSWETLIMVSAWIGLVINMFLPTFIILFALLPKFARKTASAVVGLGAKMKIVKDKEKTLAKAEKVVSDFRSGFIIMSHHPLNFIVLLLLCLTDVLLTFSLPYCMMKTFNALTEESGFLTVFSVMALNVYAAQSVTIIPSPGNSGAMEGVVTKAFSAVAGTSVLFWVVFTWRFAVYYIYIIIGLGITVFEFIRRLVRARRQKRQEAGTPPEGKE